MSELLWSDEERPWVNEYLNSPSKLGMAARTVSRWGEDWHRDKQDKATYDSAYNDVADMADTITSLLVERDDLQARITELEAQLAAASRWQPLPNGRYRTGDDGMFVVIDDDMLTVTLDIGEDSYEIYIDMGNERLCRRAPAAGE